MRKEKANAEQRFVLRVLRLLFSQQTGPGIVYAVGQPVQPVQIEISSVPGKLGDFIHKCFYRIIGIQEPNHKTVKFIERIKGSITALVKYSIEPVHRDYLISGEFAAVSKKDQIADQIGAVKIQFALKISAHGIFAGTALLVSFIGIIAAIDIVDFCLLFFEVLFNPGDDFVI